MRTDEEVNEMQEEAKALTRQIKIKHRSLQARGRRRSGGKFALSRRKQGFESPRERQ